MRQTMRKSADYADGLTVGELGQVFKLPPEAVRNLIRRGEIQAIRIGKQYRIPQHVVDRYFGQELPPGERWLSTLRRKPAASPAYANALRQRDRRTAEGVLKDMARDDYGVSASERPAAQYGCLAPAGRREISHVIRDPGVGIEGTVDEGDVHGPSAQCS